METKEKTCKICGFHGDISLFRAQKQCADGHLNQCKECHRKMSREWYHNNPDKIRESRRKTCEKNREKRNAYFAKLREKNREKFRLYAQEYRRKNKEKFYAGVAKWNRAHPESCRAYVKNRLILKKGSSGNVSAAAWELIKKMCGNKCVVCGGSVEHLSQDHIIPLVMGGEHDIGNLQPVCISCNSKKARKAIDYRPAYVRIAIGLWG